jgi:tRNA-2-methylthio-N6-dimethylallyladenosine synthase
MNTSDTERVCNILDSAGHEETLNIFDADIVIFNTCAIKQKAEDKVFSLINNVSKNALKHKRNIKILLTGCMVQKTSLQTSKKRDPLLIRIPALFGVFRILESEDLPSLLLEKKISETSLKTAHNFFKIPHKYHSKTIAFIPIQSGCDNFCTYCIVPYTRGREFSRSVSDIIDEIKNAVSQGKKEIWLIGQNVNSYGKGNKDTKRIFNETTFKWETGEEKTPFASLLEKIHDIPGVERIRFQSSNPHDMTDDIIETITTLPKIMPWLHFALQSGNDEVLQRMNRKHSAQDFITIIEKIRKKKSDFAISTDIIVGFCDETDEEFEDTLKILQKIDIDMIYLSQYSERKGTLAQRNLKDSVSREKKHERWHTVNNFLKTHLYQKYETFIGKTFSVLIEKEIQKNVFEGKTEHFRTCEVHGENIHIGDIVPVKITSHSNWALTGKKV